MLISYFFKWSLTIHLMRMITRSFGVQSRTGLFWFGAVVLQPTHRFNKEMRMRWTITLFNISLVERWSEHWLVIIKFRWRSIVHWLGWVIDGKDACNGTSRQYSSRYSQPNLARRVSLLHSLVVCTLYVWLERLNRMKGSDVDSKLKNPLLTSLVPHRMWCDVCADAFYHRNFYHLIA